MFQPARSDNSTRGRAVLSFGCLMIDLIFIRVFSSFVFVIASCICTVSISNVPITATRNGPQNSYTTSSSSSTTQQEQPARPYSPGALDVINADRQRAGLAPLKGVEDVRLRDSFQADRLRSPPVVQSTFTSPQRSLGVTATLSEAERERLKKFESTRTNSIRPVVFQPNGSFRALKENGKLAVGPEEADVYKGRIKNPLANTAYHLPGYTGFVRGRQHISARTFGETTRRALSTDYREIVCSSPVPSSPQANRKIRHEDLKDTFVTKIFAGKTYQIPGYTGFVPGVRSTYAKRYGAATEQEMFNHSIRYPRQDNQSAGFARTQLPREHYAVSSAPLPGGATSQAPPDMYIPEHVRYLKFFPM